MMWQHKIECDLMDKVKLKLSELVHIQELLLGVSVYYRLIIVTKVQESIF